jgi:transposase InsO family protein/biotin operon repressor
MSHPNAKLTPAGRLLIIRQLEAGFSQAEIARRMYLSRATVGKWVRRYREEGLEGLQDRTSRAKHLPHALGEEVMAAICQLRRELGAGPHRLAWELGMARSTIYGVLKRAGLSVLSHMERTTRTVIRYERSRPGELVHLDVKKLGRIPEGGGKRFDEGFLETGSGRHRPGKRGFEYVHIAVDDHSRFAYAEVLADEKGSTTAAFLERTVLAFAQAGIAVERVLSDNGGNYRSLAVQAVASEHGVRLKRTRPYRPQTNGKAEAFNKTLQREWAYRRPYPSNEGRLAALQTFLDDYNFARPHTAIGNRPPASRL